MQGSKYKACDVPRWHVLLLELIPPCQAHDVMSVHSMLTLFTTAVLALQRYVFKHWFEINLLIFKVRPLDSLQYCIQKQPRSCNTGLRITICFFSTFRNTRSISKYLATCPKRLPVSSCGITKHTVSKCQHALHLGKAISLTSNFQPPCIIFIPTITCTWKLIAWLVQCHALSHLTYWPSWWNHLTCPAWDSLL